MGAKTAVKLRNRGSAYKCDLCGRKLMTPDALVVHQRTAHNIITRRTKPKPVTKPVKSPKVEIKEKPVKKPIVTIKTTPKSSEKIVKEVEKDTSALTDNEEEDQPEEKKKTVEFECPKCFRVFMTYFPAHKHIQKFHCVNKQGAKVPPNSPHLIQPVRIELCLKCKRKVKSLQTHVCESIKEKSAQGQVFLCTACEEWFPNLKSFDIHVLSLHGNEVESMFFPTSLEFTKWRIDMEEQTKVKYAIIENYDSKKYYHCSYVKEDKAKNNITYFCPSTIVVQEFSKGIQVHFYKQHYKHVSEEYTLSDKYKKYSITSFLKKSEEYNLLPSSTSNENDMYLQFKTLMEGIVIDAAKINISTLRVLIGKALDMTSILTNYDEEDENTSVIRNSSRNMNDSQISKALEESNVTSKRKNIDKIDSPVDIKRTKIDTIREKSPITPSPKILNSFSLANNVEVKNKLNNGENKTKDVVSNKLDAESMKESGASLDSFNNSSTEQVPSSFNDSYKDFVVRNFPLKDKKKKKLVKTKIGQFKPTSPKSTLDSVSIKSPVAKSPVTKSPVTKSPVSKSPVSKSPVNSKPVKPVTQVKVAVKKDLKKVNRVSLDKPKVDFEYEVKEQEDGCNILILKI